MCALFHVHMHLCLCVLEIPAVPPWAVSDQTADARLRGLGTSEEGWGLLVPMGQVTAGGTGLHLSGSLFYVMWLQEMHMAW